MLLVIIRSEIRKCLPDTPSYLELCMLQIEGVPLCKFVLSEFITTQQTTITIYNQLSEARLSKHAQAKPWVMLYFWQFSKYMQAKVCLKKFELRAYSECSCCFILLYLSSVTNHTKNARCDTILTR